MSAEYFSGRQLKKKKRPEIAKIDRKIALLSLYLQYYICTMYENPRGPWPPCPALPTPRGLGTRGGATGETGGTALLLTKVIFVNRLNPLRQY